MTAALRIGLDVHMVGGRETGNETYALELARALSRRSDVDLILYATRHGDGLPGAKRIRRLPLVPNALRLAAIYPALAARDGLDLLHVTYVSPPLAPCPAVVSVHDVTFKLFPEQFSPRDLRVLNGFVGTSARRASAVLALSESSKRDIVRHLGVPDDRVTVTPLAAASEFTPAAQESVPELRYRLQLPTRFILAVGNLQPRKNLPRLIRAFAALAGHLRDVDLVLAGQTGWHGHDVRDQIRTLGLGGRVHTLGYVDQPDLPGLYAAAECLCYPSLYEGFGLPVVEAMACGTPAVTGNTSSLPEVVGDAGIMVDPTSEADLAGALTRLLTDASLRVRLAAASIRRAALFSWDRTGQLTVDAYHKALGRTVDDRGPIPSSSGESRLD